MKTIVKQHKESISTEPAEAIWKRRRPGKALRKCSAEKLRSANSAAKCVLDAAKRAPRNGLVQGPSPEFWRGGARLILSSLRQNLRSSFIGMMAVTTVSSVLASIRLDSLLGDHGSENWKRVFESALDAIIIDQVSDKGSNMLPAMKDVAVRLSSITNTVRDIGPCCIHIAQKIKNTVKEVRNQVGRMHCFGNISRQASFFIANCHAVEYLSEQVVRIPMGPPEEANDLELLIEILYDLSGAWHRRKTEEGEPSKHSFLHLSLIHISEPTRPY